MKRFLVILAALAVICALILSGCSNPTPTPSATPKSPATSAAPVPATSAAPVPATSAAPAPASSSVAPKPSASAPASSVAPSAGAKTIKFGYTMPKGASIGAGFEWFATEFPKRTNGRYVVQTYPNNTLAPVNGALDAVTSGAAEMMGTSTGTFPKNFPLSLVVSIPTLGFPGGVISSYVEGSAALFDLYNAVPEVKNEFKDYQLVWTYTLDPYNLVSKKKDIHLPSDFKGMKIGGSGAKMDIVTAAGGAKVAMAPPDSYENLDKGIVDACFITFSQVNDYKIYEIANSYNKQDFGGGNYVILMNKTFFASMSPDDQKILTDTWKEANVVSGQTSLTGVVAGIKAVQDAKRTIITPTPAEVKAWQDAAVVSIQSWMNDAKALNISQALLDKTLAAWKAALAAHLPNVK
jgi:TRAP-type C4-dicarboxylate transport system substrate-binding protein